MGQAVAYAPVTQRARVRSPVGTSFLGEVSSVFFLTCKTNVRKLYATMVPRIAFVFNVGVVSEVAPTLS